MTRNIQEYINGLVNKQRIYYLDLNNTIPKVYSEQHKCSNCQQQLSGKLYCQSCYSGRQLEGKITDLKEFKSQLIAELLAALKSQTIQPQKKWLKSHEVRRLLKISPGTLQTLKSTGVIPYTKVGGVHFFDYEDIQHVLESGKINYRI